jgi:hypothetical protein
MNEVQKRLLKNNEKFHLPNIKRTPAPMTPTVLILSREDELIKRANAELRLSKAR